MKDGYNSANRYLLCSINLYFCFEKTLNAFAVNITIILVAHLGLFLLQCTGIDTQAQLPDI